MRYLFLLVPVVAVLATPFYNTTETHAFGIPYFWWFQLVMIPLSALFILAVYLGDRK